MEIPKPRNPNNVQIIIDEDYIIEVDRFNWTVLEKHKATRGKNKGQSVWTEDSYCSSLDRALEEIIQLKSLRMLPVISVADYLSSLVSITSEIRSSLTEQIGSIIRGIKMNGVPVAGKYIEIND